MCACVRVHVCLCAPVSLCARVSVCAHVCGGEALARGSEPTGPGSLPLPPSSRPLTSVGLPGPFRWPLSEAGVWRRPPCLPAWSSGGRAGRDPRRVGEVHTPHGSEHLQLFGEGCLGRSGAPWAGSPLGLWGRPPSRGAAGGAGGSGAGGAHTGPPSGEVRLLMHRTAPSSAPAGLRQRSGPGTHAAVGTGG